MKEDVVPGLPLHVIATASYAKQEATERDKRERLLI